MSLMCDCHAFINKRIYLQQSVDRNAERNTLAIAKFVVRLIHWAVLTSSDGRG